MSQDSECAIGDDEHLRDECQVKMSRQQLQTESQAQANRIPPCASLHEGLDAPEGHRQPGNGSADQFAIHLCQQNRRGIKQVLKAMVAKRTRPPIELDYMIDQLEGALPKFVESLRAIN